jgi:hypothetical protein
MVMKAAVVISQQIPDVIYLRDNGIRLHKKK